MSWIDNKDAQKSLDILGTLALTCKELGGPVSAEIYDLVSSRDYLALVSYEIDYSRFTNDYTSISDAIYARQILGFFQKLNFLDLGIDRKVAASERFVESEWMCERTNARLSLHRHYPSLNGSDAARILYYAQQKIVEILGELPPLSEFAFAFGPGANTNVKGALACPRAKLSVPIACSTNMTPTVHEFLSEVPAWAGLHAVGESEDSFIVDVTPSPGKVVFVPKNAKTDRSIVVEPILNSFIQKGIGSYIKERLLRFGVDLHDQSINQRRACVGSVDGSLATVDLSMASDCLAKELVFSLLPFEWSDLLDRTRTSTVLIPESVHRYNLPNASRLEFDAESSLWKHTLSKFSSMGNGFTFELESLIFYAICFGVCKVGGFSEKNISVYGDDLIVPAKCMPLLKKSLEYCGFRLNDAKSFSNGPFRESCGADYLFGFDIRPFYQKTLVSERTLFTLHNFFVRHCELTLASVVEGLCDPRYVIYGPDGYGDGHLIGSHSIRRNRRLTRLGWCGGFFDTYVLKAKTFCKVLPGDAVLPVYSVYTRSGRDNPTDPDVVRGSNGYAKISIYTLSRNIFSSRE